MFTSMAAETCVLSCWNMSYISRWDDFLYPTNILCHMSLYISWCNGVDLLMNSCWILGWDTAVMLLNWWLKSCLNGVWECLKQLVSSLDQFLCLTHNFIWNLIFLLTTHINTYNHIKQDIEKLGRECEDLLLSAHDSPMWEGHWACRLFGVEDDVATGQWRIQDPGRGGLGPGREEQFLHIV